MAIARVTLEQYLELDAKSEVRNEYYNGQMFAMAGGSPRHSQIIARISAQVLASADLRGCTAYSSDLRIKAGPDYFYPDVSVVCGPVQLSGEIEQSVMNPMFIVEVLSRTTNQFDRGRKLIAYRSIPSLHEYVLIAQLEPRIERYSRNPDNTWLYTDAFSTDSTIYLMSLDATIAPSENLSRRDIRRTLRTSDIVRLPL